MDTSVGTHPPRAAGGGPPARRAWGAADAARQGWRLAPGLELLGRVDGSGLREETYLVRRSDGQVVQVSELVNLVLTAVGPDGRPVRSPPG